MKSINPQEKVVPIAISSILISANEIPAKIQWTTNTKGATNKNVNSIGSVIPVRKLVKAAESNNPPTIFFLFGFAQWYIARAAPGSPPIINEYFPVINLAASMLKRVVFGDTNSAKNMFCAPETIVPSIIALPPSPVCQNGMYQMWWSPKGINILSINPKINIPMSPEPVTTLPIENIPCWITGQIAKEINPTTI